MNTTYIYIPKDKHQKSCLSSEEIYPVLTHLIIEKGPYLQKLAQSWNEGHTFMLLLITATIPAV